jgi:adenylate cyclase
LAALGTDHFYEATAQALVELIGLDRGMVLVREESEWSIMAHQTARGCATRGYSKTVVDHVVEQRRMLFECPVAEIGTSSLQGIEAVVAAPFFDDRNQVAGVVYGSRDRQTKRRRYEIKPLEALLVQLLAGIVGSGTVNLRHKIDVMVERSRFEQFCSAEVAAELQRNPQLLEGSERDVSVVFADLRDFTALSEQIQADDLYKVLIGVMDQLTACILRSGGFIIDYYGDGVCAMWNAPLEQPNHADLACQACVQIVEELPEINASWSTLAGRPLDVGIGVNTGRTWVGNAGSSQRLKYGPRGHAVNFASRIQGATKRFGVRVLISEATRQLLSPSVASRRVGKTLLAGLPEATDLFELQSVTRDAAAMRINEMYDRALSHFERANLAECQQILESALDGPDACPDDGPMRCLYGIVKNLSTTGGSVYSPVFRFNQK